MLFDFLYILQLSINSTILYCILLLEKKISFLQYDTGLVGYLYESIAYQLKIIKSMRRRGSQTTF